MGALKKSSVLNDVFPAHIAKRLEEGKKVHPEHKDDVTIFFSDIVGFTNISAQLTPAAVSDMLDRLYSTFDELTHKHGVFKVETIGVARGFGPQPQHPRQHCRVSVQEEAGPHALCRQHQRVCPLLPERCPFDAQPCARTTTAAAATTAAP